MIFGYGCVDVRDHLEAFHDGELPIDERIAIQQHLGECGVCNAAASELAELGSTLRDFAAAAEHQPVDTLRISAHVIERLKVEESFSMRAQITERFQDMHLVWAGIGASVATAICIAGSASVLHAANQDLPSLARQGGFRSRAAGSSLRGNPRGNCPHYDGTTWIPRRKT